MERVYITKAENAGNLTISLTFSDNTTRVVDIGDFIRRHPHPQYNKYLTLVNSAVSPLTAATLFGERIGT